MTVGTGGRASATERSELERLFSSMARIRSFEDAVMRAFMSGEIRGTTHLCSGQEATSSECAKRSEAMFAEFLGREGGVCGGCGGSMNVIDLEHRLLGCFGIVGGSIGAATGAALAAELAATAAWPPPSSATGP
jgi:TPP-dependent pyruvate/acetoin dehydrogenase alpha subunit